jgi:hypothetical protein
MKYGKVLVSPKNQFFLQILTFYTILYLKNMIRAKTKFPSVTCRRRHRRTQKFVPRLQPPPFQFLKFFEQKFCKTVISNLGMAITLAHCKLRSKTWCHFVRIENLNKNSQKLFKKVRNGYNFGYIQAREVHLVSFCAYWSSLCDLILTVWNF